MVLDVWVTCPLVPLLYYMAWWFALVVSILCCISCSFSHFYRHVLVFVPFAATALGILTIAVMILLERCCKGRIANVSIITRAMYGVVGVWVSSVEQYCWLVKLHPCISDHSTQIMHACSKPAIVQSQSRSQARLMFVTTLEHKNYECKFSLSMGGAHSQVKAYGIASPTSPGGSAFEVFYITCSLIFVLCSNCN